VNTERAVEHFVDLEIGRSRRSLAHVFGDSTNRSTANTPTPQFYFGHAQSDAFSGIEWAAR
jgi:hypothetical protein